MEQILVQIWEDLQKVKGKNKAGNIDEQPL